jgi:hypothetical protein
MIYLKALLRALRKMGTETLAAAIAAGLLLGTFWVLFNMPWLVCGFALLCWLGYRFSVALEEIQPADLDDMD